MRLRHLDGLRGIAALVVAVGHMLRMDPNMLTGSFADAPHWQQAMWPLGAGAQMVWLFLMVSAFSLVYSEDMRREQGRPSSVGVFLRRRWWRIVPLYTVAVLFGAVLMLAPLTVAALPHIGIPIAQPTAHGLLAQLTFTSNAPGSSAWAQGNAALWSVPYEVQLYAVLPLLAWLLRRRQWFVPVFGVLAVAEISQTADSPLHAHLAGFFVLGAVAARSYQWVRREYAPLLVVSGIGSFLVLLMSDTPLDGPHMAGSAGAFYLLLVGMAAAPGARWNLCERRPVAALGLRSYSLYAMHLPATLFTAGVLVATVGQVPAFASLLLAGATTALVVEVTYRRIEIPSLARSRAVGQSGMTVMRRRLNAAVPPVTRYFKVKVLDPAVSPVSTIAAVLTNSDDPLSK